MAGCNPAGNITTMGTATVWQSWNTQYFVGIDNGTTACGTWNNAYSQTYVTGDATALLTQLGYVTGNVATYVQGQFIDERTPEQIEADRVRQQNEARIANERKLLAKKKATDALKDTLSKRQIEQFDKEGTFELQVNDRLYRIRPGSGVERICPQTKKVQSYFCIHPHNAHELPAEDVALSQKLLLEAAEAEFLALANETRAA